MMTREFNYWLTTFPESETPTSNLPEKTNVVVIGSGFSGCSAALELAKAGTSVCVLEAETIGWGASSRNGGMILTGLKLGPETLISRYGIERTQKMFALSQAALNTVENYVTGEKIDCEFSRCGHLEMASKPAHFAAYSRTAEVMDKYFDHHVEIFPRQDQSAEIGSNVYFGGLLDKTSAGVNPALLVRGLAQAAVRAGAQIFEHTRVQKIESTPGGVAVHTNRGIIHAEKVFAATNAYLGNFLPHLQKRIIPIGSYIIATEPLPDSLAKELIPRNRMVFDSLNYLHYFRLTPDQRMLFGGRAIFKPETEHTVRESVPILQRDLLKVFPQLEKIPLDYAWGGTLDFALDNMPHTGRVGAIHHSIGFAGHGVAFATHLGKIVASQMLGNPVDNPFEDLPFRQVPFSKGIPFYLPMIGWYYKMLDLLF